jgi:flagellin
MPSTINTNIGSLTAQRNQNRTQNDLQTSIARLSSGLRINSAKDDAAGLAIADRFTAQIRGLNQAARNANDGVSLAQTAEGSLASVTDNLQRIRELAVQSVNASNSASDRTSLQLEVTQLTAEINRVATQTSFNGTNLLDGSFTSKVFQVGANQNQTITVSSIASAKTTDLGASYIASKTSTVTLTGAAYTAGDLSLNGVSIAAPVVGPLAGQTIISAYAIAQAINGSQGSVLATANSTGYTGVATTAAIMTGLVINGVTVATVAAQGTVALQGVANAAAINQVSAATGVTATDNGAGVLTLAAADGRNILVASPGTSGLTAQNNYATITLTTNSSNAAGADIVIAGNTPGNAGFAASTTPATLSGVSISNVDISSVSGANAAIASVDAALKSVDSSRASLGAIQNRFTSTITNLQVNSDNLSASRSRIQDADFAQETAALARAQVLQQAGTAMIAQANQMPNQVLSLLR